MQLQYIGIRYVPTTLKLMVFVYLEVIFWNGSLLNPFLIFLCSKMFSRVDVWQINDYDDDNDADENRKNNKYNDRFDK